MRSFLLDYWTRPEAKPSASLRGIERLLAASWMPRLLGYAMGALALAGLLLGDWRMAALGVAACLSRWLMRRDMAWAFLLFGLAWTLSAKVPMPWWELRLIQIRLDDLLLLLLLVESARKGLSWQRNPLYRPILLFLIAAGFSSVVGMFRHTIGDPWFPFFHLVKWCEYFLLFFLAYHAQDAARAMRYLFAGMAVALLPLSAYGLWEHFNPFVEIFGGNYYRLYERGPFSGQANHFGVHWVIFLSLALPVLAKGGRGLRPVLFFAGCLLTSFAMFWTYSRIAYVALALSFGVILLLRRRWRVLLLGACLVAVPVLSSPRVLERVGWLSIEKNMRATEHASSVKARLARWDALEDSIGRYPVLGTGIGSRHRNFYEGFWMMLVCETGMLGTVLFLGILAAAARLLWMALQRTQAGGQDPDPYLLGFAGAFVALMLVAVTLVGFVITVIAAPLWMCLGLALRQGLGQAPPQGPVLIGFEGSVERSREQACALA